MQDVIDKKKLKEGESPIDEINAEQNLPDMMQLRHVWGYGREDIGKKMVSAIIYKYLMERMMLKQHVPMHFLSKRFATTKSTLHKYIVGTKYKGGAQMGKYKPSESKEWTHKQKDCDDVNKGASRSGVTTMDKPKGKGVGKRSGKSRDVAEIQEDTSKPKKKRRVVDDDNDEEDKEEEDPNRAQKEPVTAKGLVIKN